MALTVASIAKLPTSKKVVILLVFLALVSGIYVQRFFLPSRDGLASLQSDLDRLMKELNESKTITRDLQRYKEEVAKMEGELQKALTQLPNEKEIPEILKNITNLGKDSNLEFSLFRPKPEEPQEFYAKVPIELVVWGSYHNTGLFFDRVGKLPRIINVVDFNMTRGKEVKGRGDTEIVVKTSCLINTYRFAEKKSEGKKSDEKKTEKKEPVQESDEDVPKAKK